MNKEIMEGNWKQMKGKVKAKWGDLTDDDMTEIDGNMDILVGKLEEKYGMEKEEAIKRIEEMEWKD